MDLELHGKRALVTGGTKGIGRAIAQVFADEGADVAVCARDADGVTETVAELKGRGVRAVGGAIDVADAYAYRNWVASACEELGGLDTFVANVSALARGWEETSWQKMFETDLMHTVHGYEIARPHLERSGSGSIVVLSSVSANLSDAGGGQAYGAIKGAMISFASQLARELGPGGVRVNTVSPGPVEFPGGLWDIAREADPERYQNARNRTALGRHGTPEEIARAVAFVASPAASYITGANIRVDGGAMPTVSY